ncbi:unnamed protein product [Spodoptera exigua]|nr:unnamed protein product [Spodoptera exigua]
MRAASSLFCEYFSQAVTANSTASARISSDMSECLIRGYVCITFSGAAPGTRTSSPIVNKTHKYPSKRDTITCKIKLSKHNTSFCGPSDATSPRCLPVALETDGRREDSD